LNAPIDVILTPHDVVQPDFVVVTDPGQVTGRADPGHVTGREIEGPPALVVEVLSPGPADYDRTTKARRYAALGIRHFRLVDPDARTLECYRREAAGEGSRALRRREGAYSSAGPDAAAVPDAHWAARATDA
jgi:Uma2 family endonuclease